MSESRAADRGATLALVALFGYVLLLGLGILAEAFEIDSILAWPIY